MVRTWTGLFTDHCSAHCPARFTACLPPPLSPDKAYNRCSELPGRQLSHCPARSGLAQLHGCSCAWRDGFSIPWPPPPGSSSSPPAATTKVSPDFTRWLRGQRRHHPQGKATTLDRALDSQSHFGRQTQGPAAALGAHHLPRPACSPGTSLRPSTPPRPAGLHLSGPRCTCPRSGRMDGDAPGYGALAEGGGSTKCGPPTLRNIIEPLKESTWTPATTWTDRRTRC